MILINKRVSIILSSNFLFMAEKEHGAMRMQSQLMPRVITKVVIYLTPNHLTIMPGMIRSGTPLVPSTIWKENFQINWTVTYLK